MMSPGVCSTIWIAVQSLLLLASPAEIQLTVETLGGSTLRGKLLQLDSQRVVVDVEGQSQSIETREILSLRPPKSASNPAADTSAWVLLMGGSLIHATDYTVSGREARMQVGKRTITVDTRNIRAVRFHAPAETTNEQWQAILQGELTGDVVVLRRSSTSLDQLEGVFHDVTKETVEFDYDDQRIPVNRQRLEGMVYFHPLDRDLPEPICTLHEANGTLWQIGSMQLSDTQLQAVAACGTKLDVPIEAMARIDYSSGNVSFLSDLDFELVECSPFIASRVSPKRILQLYQPRRDSSFEGDGLWLGRGDEAKRYERGLAVHSRSILVFRLTEEYRKFSTVVGIDSRLRGRGDLVLVIAGDDKELFRKTITGEDPPLPIDLDVQGVRRLKLQVEFGQTLDVADHLNLCNAKVIK